MEKDEEKLLAVVVQRGVSDREGRPEASVTGVLWPLAGCCWMEMTTAAQHAGDALAWGCRDLVAGGSVDAEVQCQGWEWCATSEMLSPAAS